MFKNPSFATGFAVIALVALGAALAGHATGYEFDAINMSEVLKSPSRANWLGTDQYGRDLFTRVLFGARIALRVGFIAVAIESLIGVTLGLISGYLGGYVERAILFVTDLTWAMPPVILAMAIVTVLGPSVNNVAVSIAVVSWAQFTRVVRAKTLSLKELPYIEAAESIGESGLSILVRYILPNVAPSIIVLATLSLPSAIMSTTALGFLGLGAQPPTPDWGVMLSEGISYIEDASWLSVFPGVAIVVLVVGFNFLGEGLRELIDPRIKL
ncbi:MAG: ABC transporter permease [Synergistaceae bacterium]|jgi:peptide/nickel transport system permease protein|nr:ABC transporter permease [Synergistaceae bacterium]